MMLILLLRVSHSPVGFHFWYSWGWSWIPNSSTSTSQMLGLQVFPMTLNYLDYLFFFQKLKKMFYVFCLHVCLCTMGAWCPRVPEGGTGSLRPVVTDSCYLPWMCWESNSGHLECRVGNTLNHWAMSSALGWLFYIHCPVFRRIQSWPILLCRKQAEGGRCLPTVWCLTVKEQS